MLSVEEAWNLVREHTKIQPWTSLNISKLRYEVLAEEISADRDYPPFDRVAMDGIAIAYSSWIKGVRQFPIQGCQQAGEKSKPLLSENACLEVMTGAPLPQGCDCVIPYESLKLVEKTAYLDNGHNPKRFQNIHQRGMRGQNQIFP